MKPVKRFRMRGLSMRVYLTLLVVVEIGVITVVASFGAGLPEYFQITLDIPDLVWIVALSVLLGGAVTTALGRWLFAPITRLGEAMNQVAKGNFEIRLEEKSMFREIRKINANFNLMAGELGATEILQTDFVSNVSHEFKTPINAIEGYATLLQGAPMEDEQAGYVEKILFNTRRLSNLVGNILLLSKVDNQVIPDKQTTFRLDEQIRQSIVLLEPEWAKKDLEFDVDLECASYTGHENLLLHVWNNLIGNAIKFDPPGGLVRIRMETRGTRIAVEIQDSGPGISPEDQKHIFDRFFQSDSSHKEEGNGLGLALVKRILKISGGEITVENLPQGGCCFTVLL